MRAVKIDFRGVSDMKRRRGGGLFENRDESTEKKPPSVANEHFKYLFIGIDPGQSGAFAMINENLDIVCIHDWSMEANVAAILRKINAEAIGKGRIINAALEYAHAMPKQGVSSMFKFGANYGIWQGILATLQIPYLIVTPQKWQKGVIKKAETKEPAISAAGRLFPTAELYGPRGGKKDGRADALLIAYWCKRNLKGEV
jgi:crossover junction endodeoxyribonuclease RuvC